MTFTNTSNKLRIRRACAFVDFNTQLRAAPKTLRDDPEARCGYALRNVGKAITKKLCGLDGTSRFRVSLRLYHGWTTGITHTANRCAVAGLPEFDQPDYLYPSARVLSYGDIEFGDRLIDGLPERENPGLWIHLPNTSRRQRKREPLAEKMVDTALAADLLSWARQEPDSVALVFSSDDDIIPPVFVAEAWMRPAGGIVKLSQQSYRTENKFLLLQGLLD